MGTAWFLAIIIISALAVVFPVDNTILWLILGICGAVVAIMNIKVREQIPFLVGVASLTVIIASLFIIPAFSPVAQSQLGKFLANLIIAFGVSGFIVALGVISKIELGK